MCSAAPSVHPPRHLRVPDRPHPRDGGRGGPDRRRGSFRSLMAEQRQRAKDDARARKHAHADLTVYKELLDRGPTEFTGFSELVTEAHVLAVITGGERLHAASAASRSS